MFWSLFPITYVAYNRVIHINLVSEDTKYSYACHYYNYYYYYYSVSLLWNKVVSKHQLVSNFVDDAIKLNENMCSVLLFGWWSSCSLETCALFYCLVGEVLAPWKHVLCSTVWLVKFLLLGNMCSVLLFGWWSSCSLETCALFYCLVGEVLAPWKRLAIKSKEGCSWSTKTSALWLVGFDLLCSCY